MCDSGAAHHLAPAAGGTSDDERRLRIPLEPVDAVTLTILVENVFDVFMPDQGPAHRFNPASMTGRVATSTMEEGSVPEGLVAEHGYSLFVTVRRGEQSHSVLFDRGITPDGMVENMRRLSIDPRDVEAVICSHGHFDHTAGLDGLIRSVGRTGLPVLIHPDFWNRRRMLIPGRDPMEIPTTSRSALEAAGFAIIEERQPSFLLDNAILVTGEVDRTTGYEPGFPPQQAYRNGAWEPDPLALDDQALIVNVRERGLVVITGCGHAGIVNITRYARALTGVDQVHAIIGGCHLNGPLFEPLIGRVCDDLAAMEPDIIVPGHCTGWRAQHAMGRVFGERFIPSCVGTRLDLEAAAASQ